MMHPHTELRFISAEKGFGVVATQLIPKGAITWAGDALDHRFTAAQLTALHPMQLQIVDKYSYRDQSGHYVLCWDIARYVNHSYRSNCLTTPYNFELAVRDILPGEELTDDYGYLNVEEPLFFPREAGSERTAVYPDDLLRYHAQWDEQLNAAFALFGKLEQPLQVFIADKYRDTVARIAAGRQPMDSIRNCYYQQE